MSAPVDDTPTERNSDCPSQGTPTDPRFIRAFAVPIILAWIAIIALLNTVVPQLEEVGKLRAVSMSPNDAPSMIATKRVGEVFRSTTPASSVMIVLEGHDTLGVDAHHFYDEIVQKPGPTPSTSSTSKTSGATRSPRRAPKAWTARRPTSRSTSAGDQGEALANESVEAVRAVANETPAPAGVRPTSRALRNDRGSNAIGARACR